MSNFKKLSLGSAVVVSLITIMMIAGCGAAASNSSPTSSKGDTGVKGDAGAQGAPGVAAVATGNLIGYVQVLDENGRPLSDKSGVVVSIEAPSRLVAQSTHALPRATTTSSGKFVIKNLRAGIYTIRIHKDGYEDYVGYNFQFNGGGDVPYTIPPGAFNLIPTLRAAPAYIILSVESVSIGSWVFVSVSVASPTGGAIADGTSIAAKVYGGGSDVSSTKNVVSVELSATVSGGKAIFSGYTSQKKFLGSSTIRIYPLNNGGDAYDYDTYDRYSLSVTSYFNPITEKWVVLGLGKPSDAILIPAQKTPTPAPESPTPAE